MGSGNFTLSVRFMIPKKSGLGANLVSKVPPLGGPDTGIKQIFFKDNRIHYSIDGLGTLTSKSQVDYGKWHHVVVTDHNGEVRLYVDGNLEGKKEQFTKPDVKGHILKLQERRGAWMDFRGEMSEVRFYDRHLDDTAAKALSFRQRSRRRRACAAMEACV